MSRHVGMHGESLPGISDVATTATAGLDADALCDFAAKVGPYWRSVRDDAAISGKDAHAFVAYLLRKGDIPRVRGKGGAAAVMNWIRWSTYAGVLGATPVYVEDTIVDQKRGVGGTPDAILAFPNKQIVVFDWKSSTVLLAKHVVQVCAYARAVRDELDINVTDAAAVRVPRSLTLPPSEIVIKVDSDVYKAALDVFDAGLIIHRRHRILRDALKTERRITSDADEQERQTP